MPGGLSRAFGDAMKAARTQRGMSQEELGNRSGLHRAHIGEIERGEISPTLDSLQAIAHALGLPASELLATAESKPDAGAA